MKNLSGEVEKKPTPHFYFEEAVLLLLQYFAKIQNIQ